MVSVYAVFALLAALVAYLSINHPIMSRHFAVLLTFGKVPGLRTLSTECDSIPPVKRGSSSRFGKDARCFDAEGVPRIIDANHNVSIFEEELSRALKIKCPVIIKKVMKQNIYIFILIFRYRFLLFAIQSSCII